MPGLNKRQKEFRKQIKQIEQVKTYKDIMNDHNSFYHNTAYDNELHEKAEKRRKNQKRIIELCILGIMIFIVHKNFEMIKTHIEELIPEKDQEQTTKIYNNNLYRDDEIKQYEAGLYYKNYRKKIETINTIHSTVLDPNNFYNYDITKIKEQLNVINSLTNEFITYIPDDINQNLHNININTLIALKNKYNAALNLSENYQDQNQLNILNNENQTINLLNSNYQTELLKVFDEIHMNYTITQDGKITFTYKNIGN